jgi:hypothetical protein
MPTPLAALDDGTAMRQALPYKRIAIPCLAINMHELPFRRFPVIGGCRNEREGLPHSGHRGSQPRSSFSMAI